MKDAAGQAEPSYGQGLYGHALALSASQSLRVPLGRLNRAKGTVAFWFKPRWDAQDGAMHRLFWLPGNGLVVEKDQHDRLSFRIAQVHVWAPAQWKAGDRWHHVVVSWSDPEVLLCLDGIVYQRLLGRGRARIQGNLEIGSAHVGGGGQEGANLLLDDLVILDRDMTPVQMRTLYAAGKPATELAKNTVPLLSRLRNLALDRPVRTDASENWGHLAVNDGHRDTAHIPRAGSHWVEVDLGRVGTINRIAVRSNARKLGATRFSLAVSTSGGFSGKEHVVWDEADGQPVVRREGMQIIDFSPTPARYVRWWITVDPAISAKKPRVFTAATRWGWWRPGPQSALWKEIEVYHDQVLDGKIRL